MLRPSTYPVSLRPSRNAVACLAYGVADPALSKPTTGIVGCCARAARGRVVAESVTTLMKSRRRITAPKCEEPLVLDDYSRDLRLAKWGSGVSLHGSKPEPLMSALGHNRTFRSAIAMSALPPKADIHQPTAEGQT